MTGFFLPVFRLFRKSSVPREVDRYDLEMLEKRILLSAEGLATVVEIDPWAEDLTTAQIVETTATGDADSATPADADWLPAGAVETTEGISEVARNETEQTEEADDGAVADKVIPDGGLEPIDPVTTVVFVSTIQPGDPLPNGPPATKAIVQAMIASGDASAPTAAAMTLGLADTFTNELGLLDGALSSWGAFFDLGSIDWAGQGRSEVSLPVVPDSLANMFGLEVLIDTAALPDFSADETINSFVSSLDAAGFTITAIDGGYSSGGTNIAATTGTSLLEGTYSLTIGSGFGIDGGFAGDSFNDSTSGILNGLASSVNLDGSITWSGSLVLNLGFVLDSSAGLLITGDSALVLSVTGTGTLSGSGTAGGSATSFSGTGMATIDVTLGFADTSTNYVITDFTAANIAAAASGTAGVSLTFTAGPVELTFGGNYTLTADLVALTVAQAFDVTLSGTATLPGVTQSDGSTQGVVNLSGSYNSGTNEWTITGSATGLQIFALELTSLNVSTTVTSSTFAGSFDASLQTDFLSSGGSPVVIGLSATYDRTTVNVTGTASIATLNFAGTGSQTLFTATDFTATATLVGDIGAGTLTGSLAMEAGSAALMPDSTSFTASVTDGDDADALGFSGSYDFSTETLAITVDQLDVLMPDVLSVAVAGLAVTYDRRNTDPSQTIAAASSVSISLIALQESGSDPPTATVSNLTIRQDGFAFDSASVTLGDHDIGGVMTVGSLDVTLTNVDYTVGQTPTGTLELSAASATLFPGSAATATLTGISGSFNVATKAFGLSITSLDAEIGSLLTFTATGIAFGYDPTGPPEQTVFSVDTLSVAVPSTAVTGTLTGLEVTAAGNFSAVSLSLDTSGLTDALGIGDFLPFNVNSMEAVFAGDTNGNGVRDDGEVFSLNAFDLTVTGAFDFDKLSALPFTPILQIGDSELSEAGSNTFTFTVSIDSSGIKPKDIGPITIGFSDLAIGDTVVMAGSITLGGYQDGGFVSDFAGTLELVANDNMKGISGDASISITGSISGGVLDLAGDFTVSFTYGDNVSVTNASLGFTLQATAGSGFGITLNSLQLTSGSIESLSFSFGSLMTFSATDASFDFTATGSDTVAQFGSMSVAFPGLGDLSGTATNFGFAADGTFQTFSGFSVSVSASAAALKWPDWLPITIDALTITWDDLAADPADFKLILSASINSINGLDGLSVSGTVEGVVIDVGELKDGKFPITDLDTVAVSVSGGAFGGEVSGTLLVGILKLDADGNVVTSFDTDAVVAQRVLYGGVQAAFEFAGTSGFEIRIGLSELGPLQIYLGVSVPVLLEPISGLSITDFRAGVTFSSTLPDITDPFAMKDSAFVPASELTVDEWIDQLETAVANQATSGGSGDFWDVFNQPMIIQGGATLYSAYASTSTFRADIDVMFDTEGRVFINARGTFADTFSMNYRLYANLTQIQTSGTFLFLAEEPEDPTLITYYGALQFKFLAADGSAASSASTAASFFLSISGGAIAELEGVGNITLDATIELTISANKTTIEFSGSLSMSGLGNAITTAGIFVIEKNGGSTSLYGVAVLDVKFDQLEDKGIVAGGTALLEINTTNQEITTSITLPGGSPTNYTLAPKTFAAVISGSLQIQQGGADWFYMEGTFVFSLSASGLDLVVDANILIGERSNPTARLYTQGFFAIRSDGIAAKADLTLVGSFGAGAADISVDASFQLIFNTTGRTVSYSLPSGVVLSDGSTSVSVSGISPNNRAESYLYIDIRGSMTVAGAFELTNGQFTLVITPSLLRIEVVASFQLKAGNTRLLSFSVAGGIEIASNGVAAVLSLSLTQGTSNNQGWSISGTATMEFNTRNRAVTLVGVTIPRNTVRVSIDGTLSVGDLDLDGSFLFEVSGNTVTVDANATLDIQIGNTRLLRLTVDGGLSINNQGIAAVIDLSLSTGVPSGQGWSLSATFRLELNTRNNRVTISGTRVNANTVRVFIDGNLTASGFTFDGTFVMTVGSNSVSIEASASFTIAGISFSVSGAFGVFNGGIAFKLSLSLPSISTSVLTIRGTFEIAVNTTNSTRFGIARKSGYIAVTNARVTLAGFTISGSIKITSNGVISVPSSDPLTLSILGQTASFYGTLNLRTGYFDLTASININFGSRSVAQLSATITLNLYRKQVRLFGRNITVAGLNGSFSGSLYAFNIKLVNLSGTASISSDGSFSLSVSASFKLASVVNFNVTVNISVDSSRRIQLSFSGKLDLFGKFKANVSGSADTRTGNWYLTGSASASFGNSNLGARLSSYVHLSNRGFTVRVSGSGWARVKIAGIRFGIEGSFSATVTNETAKVRVSGSARAGFIKVKASKTVHINFRTGRIWLSDVAGSTVFFDANLNGVQDAGEPSTIADDTGTFTFDEPTTNLTDEEEEATLLAELDLNGDGVLGADEGNFLLVGGTPLSDETAPATDPITLAEGGLTGATDYAGATIWFDTDFDGELDADEFTVTSDENGTYTFLDVFLPVDDGINHLGELETYDLNNNGRIDPGEGTIILTGGFSVVDGSANDQIRLLGFSEGHTIYAGATIFLDLNQNETLDADEPFVFSDVEGFYHFDDHHDEVEVVSLGELAPFDLNEDGLIDETEGTLVASGGFMISENADGEFVVGEAYDGTMVLPAADASGLIDLADAVVFLDLNGNRIADDGEPLVHTDNDGYYTFSTASRADITNLGSLAPFDTNGNGEIDPSEGTLVHVGGTEIGFGLEDPDGPEDTILFDANEPHGIINFRDATVFLDLNGNGQLDDGEVSTTSDEAGYYSFIPQEEFGHDLGELSVYDTNGNGILDPEEGVFVISGGTDLNTGLPNERTLTVVATNYGSVFSTQISPLSELYTYLVLGGVSPERANEMLVVALGLPPTTDILTYDIQLEVQSSNDGQAKAKLLSILAQAGADIILSLAELAPAGRAEGIAANEALDHGTAENFLIQAVANLMVKADIGESPLLVDDDGNLIAAPALLNLHFEPILQAVLLEAISLAGLAPPPADQLNAAVVGLHHVVDRVEAMRAAQLVNLTAALARISTFVTEVFRPALDALFLGETSVTQFNQDFSEEGIRDQIRSVDLPIENVVPTITALADQSTEDFRSDQPVTVEFAVGDADGLPDEIDVHVSSSNEFLLPAENISVAGIDAARTLTYSTVEGRWGEATVTVLIDDGHAEGAGVTTTTFTVRVNYTYAEFVQTEAEIAETAAIEALAEQEKDEQSEADAELEADLAALAEAMTEGTMEPDLVLSGDSATALLAKVSLSAAERPRSMDQL